MDMTENATTVLADDARVADPQFAGRFTVLVGNRNLDVLSVTRRDNGQVVGFAVSPTTNLLFAFRVTGAVVRGYMMTARVTPAEDLGDQAGTLTFNFSPGATMAGRVNFDLVVRARTAARLCANV